MANGIVPQPPPVGGPTPQLQAPPINVAQILGQLATSPPAGPIPITPYAPANVGPLAMPGAGLAGPSGKPPPWTGTPPAQPQPAQPSVGSAMNPNLVPHQLGDTASGGGRGEVHNVAPPGPYAAQILQKLMGQQGMPPIMHQPVTVPQQQQPRPITVPQQQQPIITPQQQPYRPPAVQALLPRAPAQAPALAAAPPAQTYAQQQAQRLGLAAPRPAVPAPVQQPYQAPAAPRVAPRQVAPPPTVRPPVVAPRTVAPAPVHINPLTGKPMTYQPGGAPRNR